MTYKSVIYILCCFLLPFSLLGQEQHWTKVLPETKVTYLANDSLNMDLVLVADKTTGKMLYHSLLKTAICSDDLCLPIQINLFWDLMGDFDHFLVPNEHPFTKFDHQPFDQSDYKLLLNILKDTLSLIRDYAVEDFLDNNNHVHSLKVDAVTRPTAKVFSNVTVPGALYTAYSLWHIVNGPIKYKLKETLDKTYKERNWINLFAASNIPKYQEYFLHNLADSEVELYESSILKLIYSKDNYLPHFAWKKLGTDFWNHPLKYNTILEDMAKLKPHMVLTVLNSIGHTDQKTKSILNSFLNRNEFTKNQKETIKRIINDEK